LCLVGSNTTTVAVNDARKKALINRVTAALLADLKGKTIALLGLTFKPNTDDMRDSPALDLAPALMAAGAAVQAFDPEGMDEAARMLEGVAFKDGPYDAVTGADAVVIVTEWDQFRALDLDRVKLLLREPVMVDLRNVYRPDDMRKRGFRYSSIGRP
jgi:UDPglucose 6-dehydrogenase